MSRISKRILYYAGGGLVLLVLFWSFVPGSPANVIEKTSSSEYCAGCHLMEDYYETWLKKGHHRQLKCVDCHLPNDNIANHLLWKGITGGWDFVRFHSGFHPDPLTIHSKGKEFVDMNCLRCHEATVAKVHHEDRRCIDCHRNTRHNRIPQMFTEK